MSFHNQNIDDQNAQHDFANMDKESYQPSPAKAEQEGPWKAEVHHSVSDTEAGQPVDAELLNSVHDRIIANQKAGMSLEQAIYRTGYDDGQQSRQWPVEESPGTKLTHDQAKEREEALLDKLGRRMATKEREIAFAFYEWSVKIYRIFDGWHTAPGEEENVILSEDQVWDLFEQSQNKPNS